MSKKKLDEKTKYEIARAYYKSVLNTQQIADKYGTFESRVCKIATQYDPVMFSEKYNKSKVNIMVFEPEEFEKARTILSEYGVAYSIPDSFVIKTEYESKGNFD